MQPEQPIIQEQEEAKPSKVRTNITDFLQSVVIAISVCIVVYIAVATPNQIEGESMEPNFHNNEIVLTSKVHEWLGATDFGKSLGLVYQKGDVIVFQKPGFNDFIKRVIAGPGDKIALKNGKVYVNDQEIPENYLPPSTFTPGGTFLKENGEALTVPSANDKVEAGKPPHEDNYFVMGDNRSNSHDSRYSDIGFVQRSWMKGKVLVRYWPITSFKIIEN